MFKIHAELVRRVRRNLGLAVTIFCVATFAHAQATIASDDSSVGRLDFEAAKLPAANVELDLSEGMLGDLSNIGDAAVAGIAEAVLKVSEEGKGEHKDIHTTAEQLEAVNQIVSVLGGVVREVRVRAYESLPEEVSDVQELFKPFDHQLKSAKWETIVRVRNDEQIIRVSVLRRDGKIQGVFVVASDGDAVVLGNIVCDVSPAKVKQLTSALTQIGLKSEFKVNNVPVLTRQENGLFRVQGGVTVNPPEPLTPPAPPSPVAN